MVLRIRGLSNAKEKADEFGTAWQIPGVDAPYAIYSDLRIVNGIIGTINCKQVIRRVEQSLV
jgi:hypothetical protein